MCWANVGLVKRNSNNTIAVSILVVSLHTLSLKLVRMVLHIMRKCSMQYNSGVFALGY
jgi:hypothetical protein